MTLLKSKHWKLGDSGSLFSYHRREKTLITFCPAKISFKGEDCPPRKGGETEKTKAFYLGILELHLGEHRFQRNQNNIPLR